MEKITIAGDYTYLTYGGQNIYYDNNAIENDETTKYFRYQDYQKVYITKSDFNKDLLDYLDARYWDNILHSTSAFEYYYNARTFSSTVNKKISDINQTNAIDADGKIIEFSINTGSERIFNTEGKANDPLLSNSTFEQNRISVIRKSIESNLATAIAQYSEFSSNNYEFSLPIMNEVEWEKITNNVSVISFLQGIPIGHKYYNNYCVITNNNNEEVVKKESIYIVTEKSEQREYHLPGCKNLFETNDTIIGAYANTSFTRQTVRISEGDYLYFYPQAIKNITSGYNCLVNLAEAYDIDEIISGTVTQYNKSTGENEQKYKESTNKRFRDIRNAYMHALARERYDLHVIDIYNVK